MKRAIKILLGVIGALIVLVVAAAIVIPLVVDPNEFKPQIQQAVKDQTGRELTIEGDIGLSIFPWVAVDLGKTELGNAKGFSDEPMARIEQAEVSIKLMPLLKKEVEVGAVTLTGVQLLLETDANGKNNWDDLAQPSEEKPDDKPSSDESPIKKLNISGVSLVDSSVTYRNAQTGADYKITDLKLESGQVSMENPVPLELSLKTQMAMPTKDGKAGAQSMLDAAIQLKTVLALDLEAQKYSLSDLNLTVTASGDPVGGEAEIKLLGEVLADLGANQININGLDLQLDADSTLVGGKAKVGLTSDFSGALDSQKFAAKDIKINAQLTGKDYPGGEVKATLAGQLAVDLQQQTLSLSQLSLLALDNVKVNGDLAVSKLIDAPSYQAKLSVAEFSLRKLLAQLNVELPAMADANTLKKVSFSANASGDTESVQISDLSLNLDDTAARGEVGISQFSNPSIRFALVVDALDLDRYLPPKSDKPAASSEPSDSTDINQTPVDLSFLEALRLAGTASIGQLKANNLEMESIKLTVKAADGKAVIEPLGLKLYGGSLDGRVSADVRGGKQKISIRQNMSNLNFEPFTKALLGEPKASGRGNLAIDVTTAGATVGQIREQLNGKIKFALDDGAVHGFNLGQMLRTAKAKLKGGSDAASLSEAQQTDFAKLSGSGNIVNGLLSNVDLDGASPLLRLGGDGKIDLAKETLNYVAKVSIVETSKGQSGKGLDELKGLTVPIRLRGTFTDPKIDIDIKGVLKAALEAKYGAKVEAEKARLKARRDAEKAKLEAKRDQKKQELQDKAEQELGRGLKKLFGR